MAAHRFSIVIPARDEEAFIGGCLDSIDRAARHAGTQPEIIVVLNRCRDRTEQIVSGRAVIVREDAPNLARIRNAGAARATGEILVTIDADSRMSDNMLTEIGRKMASGRYIGGAMPIHPERASLGIVTSGILLALPFFLRGLSAGAFWCRRLDFLALGGFKEKLRLAEDYDFARRLKAYGQARKLRFGTPWKAHIVTSCRKFDRWGDWFLWRLFLTRPRACIAAFRGDNDEFADRYWYQSSGPR